MMALVLSGCVQNAGAAINDADLESPDANSAGRGATGQAAQCPVTQPAMDQLPKDPNADSFGYEPWYINTDRTIWASLPPNQPWHAGGNKVIWIRPQGTELAIVGQRLDAKVEPLKAEIPCCYPTGFQVTGLIFPTEGCWEVVAKAGNAELRFITGKRSGGREGSTLSSRAKRWRIEGCGFAGRSVGQPAPFDTHSTPFMLLRVLGRVPSERLRFIFTCSFSSPPTGHWLIGDGKPSRRKNCRQFLYLLPVIG